VTDSVGQIFGTLSGENLFNIFSCTSSEGEMRDDHIV
jgi:hypothetical protein